MGSLLAQIVPWCLPALGLAAACGAPAEPVDLDTARELMVSRWTEDLDGRPLIRDERVLAAMRTVPRQEFVPSDQRSHAYEDRPLPIGHEQTISQPYVVAFMTQVLALEPGERVLEIGTGSGYQAAVLAALGAEVFSIEIVEPLGRAAAERLERLGYAVDVRVGDGYRGWPEQAPFDAIILTAAPPRVPSPLVEQLKPGGRMILPEGEGFQQLVLLTKSEDGAVMRRSLLDVRFVPMTGEAQRRR